MSVSEWCVCVCVCVCVCEGWRERVCVSLCVCVCARVHDVCVYVYHTLPPGIPAELLATRSRLALPHEAASIACPQALRAAQ